MLVLSWSHMCFLLAKHIHMLCVVNTAILAAYNVFYLHNTHYVHL